MTTRTAILGAAAIAALVVQLGFAAPTAWAVEGVEGTPPPAETTTSVAPEPSATEDAQQDPADVGQTLIDDPAAKPVDGPTPEPTQDEQMAPQRDAGTDATGDEPIVGVAEVYTGRIYFSFHLDRVTLIDGRSYGETKGRATGVPGTVSGNATDVFDVTGTYGEDGTSGIESSAVFRIAQLGQPTDNWVIVHVYEYRGAAWADCAVYLGDPGAGGAPADPSPFTCSPEYGQRFPNAKITFDIAMNRDAEAAGIINTVGPVSLSEGTFETEPLPYHVDGSPTVGANSSTSFDVVLRAGDQPIEPNLAKSLFVYRIVDNGASTQFYVVGYSQNFRGVTRFSPESACGVYDGDPRTSATPLSSQTPAVATPYTCEVTSTRFIEYRGNYEATFAVAPRPMTTITDPIQQKELIARLCTGDAVNCGFAMATVTDTVGKGRIVSGVLNNPTDQDTKSTYAIGGSESVKIGGGFEITLSVEYNTLFGKISGSLKTSFNRYVTTTTSTVSTYEIPVPAHHKGWLEATPPMVHSEGTIIVYDGSRYFKLTNVFADFPDATRSWEYTVRSEPIVGGEQPPLDGDSPLDGPTPGIVLPAPVSAASGGVQEASRLAVTGAQFDLLPMLVTAGGFLFAGGLLLVRRGRRKAGSR
jgi:hypothetical protein